MQPLDGSDPLFCKNPCSHLGEAELLEVLGLEQLGKFQEEGMPGKLRLIDVQIGAGIKNVEIGSTAACHRKQIYISGPVATGPEM